MIAELLTCYHSNWIQRRATEQKGAWSINKFVNHSSSATRGGAPLLIHIHGYIYMCGKSGYKPEVSLAETCCVRRL